MAFEYLTIYLGNLPPFPANKVGAKMNFEPHGRFDIQTQGQILRVQFWDSWNHEGVLQFFESYKAYERFLVRKITEDNDAIPTETFQDEDQAMDWLRTQTLQSAFNRATSPPDLSAHATLPQ